MAASGLAEACETAWQEKVRWVLVSVTLDLVREREQVLESLANVPLNPR